MSSYYTKLFPSLTDGAHVWLYPTEHPLAADSRQDLLERLDAFVEQWQSHGRDVIGETDIIENRFLLIAAEIPGGDISGCGIDASVRAVDEILRPYGTTIAGGLTVFARLPNGTIQPMTRADFRARSRDGSIDQSTVVFDTTIDNLGDLRSGRFETVARASWHAQLLAAPAEPAFPDDTPQSR